MSLQEEVRLVEKAVSTLIGVETEIQRLQTILITILGKEDTTDETRLYIADALSGKWRERMN